MSVGATELHVEQGSIAESICTSPPLQAPAGTFGLRSEAKSLNKKQMDKFSLSQRYHCDLTRTKKVTALPPFVQSKPYNLDSHKLWYTCTKSKLTRALVHAYKAVLPQLLIA